LRLLWLKTVDLALCLQKNIMAERLGNATRERREGRQLGKIDRPSDVAFQASNHYQPHQMRMTD
jgi:hypothetical protein